jgi:hypothetical protein
MTLASQFDNKEKSSNELEKVILNADLSSLTGEQRVNYYMQVCNQYGLDAFTRPFEYIKLNNKLVLYATKSCASALQELKSISVEIVKQEQFQDVWIVTVRGTRANEKAADGRVIAENVGITPIKGLSGDQLSNSIMKAVTKAQRRLILQMCGLGSTDETELQSIANVSPQPVVKVEVDEQGEIAAEEVIPPEVSTVAKRVQAPTPNVDADDQDWRLQTCEVHSIDWELAENQYDTGDSHYRFHRDPSCTFSNYLKDKVLAHFELPNIAEGGKEAWGHEKVKTFFHPYVREKTSGKTLSTVSEAKRLEIVDEFLLQNKGMFNG